MEFSACFPHVFGTQNPSFLPKSSIVPFADFQEPLLRRGIKFSYGSSALNSVFCFSGKLKLESMIYGRRWYYPVFLVSCLFPTYTFLYNLHSPLCFILEVQWSLEFSISGDFSSADVLEHCFHGEPKAWVASLLWKPLNMNWRALLQIIISTTPDTMLQGNLEQT